MHKENEIDRYMRPIYAQIEEKYGHVEEKCENIKPPLCGQRVENYASYKNILRLNYIEEEISRERKHAERKI